MRKKSIELTMITGEKYFVDTADMYSGGIADNPESYIGNYISGTRGPMMRVNTLVDGSGTEHYINPKMIVSMTVTYL